MLNSSGNAPSANAGRDAAIAAARMQANERARARFAAGFRSVILRLRARWACGSTAALPEAVSRLVRQQGLNQAPLRLRFRRANSASMLNTAARPADPPAVAHPPPD